MTSYQRRLRNIKYLQQVVGETRKLCAAIVGHAKKDGHDVKIPLVGAGINGDDFLTDTNEFSMNLSMSSADKLIEYSRKK